MVSLGGVGRPERHGFRFRPRKHPHPDGRRGVGLVFLSLRNLRRRIPHLRLLRDGRRREHGVDADADNRDRCDPAQLLGPGPGDPSGNGYLSPVTVSLAGSDATSGLQSLSYRIDGGADWTYTTPFHVAGNGSYRLEYFATDQAGNRAVAHSITLQLVGNSGGGGTHAPPVTTSNRGGTKGANG